MSAVLGRLHAAGLQLRSSGEQVIVTPRSALTDELREFIRDNKAAILREIETLEQRRQKVEAELRANPEWRYAFDVANGALGRNVSEPVSVILGIRDTTGAITTGALAIPTERWDMALFLRTTEETPRMPS